MIRFLIKYWVVSTLGVIGIVYLGLDWWNEDSRRGFLLLFIQAASFGPATISYLEKGDWLRLKGGIK